VNGAPFINAHPDTATLGAYHDRELRGFARAEVEAHLAACPRCRRDLKDLDAITDALRALPQIEPSPEIHGALLARVTATRPRRARPKGWALAAVLAVLAAAAAGYDILMVPRPSLGLPASVAAPQPSRARSAARPPTVMQAPGVPGAARAGATSNPGHGGEIHARARTSTSPGRPQPGAGSVSGALTGSAGSALYTVDARLIARVGEVDMRVRDVGRAFEAAGAIAVHEGGYVAASNNSASSATHGAYAATLTLRVPSAHFQATMDALAALPHGTLTERSTSMDLTDRYHNLQAHLQALQATHDQLMALMHKSGSIRDAMAVLDRLTGVDADMDAVEGQIMASATRVMLSTITVKLAPEPHKQILIPPLWHRQASGWHPGRDLVNAVANLARALEAIITMAIYAVVYLALPALLAALALLAWRLRRRSLRAA
jgi:anti-sigma factor RsiW